MMESSVKTFLSRNFIMADLHNPWSPVQPQVMSQYSSQCQGTLSEVKVTLHMDQSRYAPANERRRYNVTTSLIGWANT